MADQKISELNAKATLHDTDLVPIVDIEADPDETKKITGANLKAQVLASTTFTSHKDRHDPEDGADKLDTAAPSELASVQAAGAGSSHSLARADHQHQIQHSIDDNHLITVDGDPNSGEYAKFTASGLEGKTAGETVTDLQNSINKIVDPTDQDTSVEAEEDQVTMDVAGTEAFKLNSIGVLTTVKQSSAGAYRNSADIKIKNATNTPIPFNAESSDIQNEMTIVTESTATAGTDDATKKLFDSTDPFVAGDVGKYVWNYANGGFTTIASFQDTDEVTLTDSIGLDNGEAYGFGYARFTATEPGVYTIAAQSTYTGLSDGKRIIVYIYVNGTAVSSSQAVIGGASSAGATTLGIIQLSATDYVEIWTYHNEGAADDLRNGSQWTYVQIAKVA